MRILFSDDKSFDIDEGYILQNDRIWAPSRSQENEGGGIVEREETSTKNDGVAQCMLKEYLSISHF